MRPAPTILLLVLAVLPPPSRPCEKGTPRECGEAEPAPGSNLAGEGFDISKMQRKGSYVIDMSLWREADKSCTLCRNPYMDGRKQKVPRAVVDWRATQKCDMKVTGSVYQSSEALITSSSSSIQNDWKVHLELDVKTSSGSLMMAGTNSKLAEYAMDKSKRDKFSFTSHSISCGFYSLSNKRNLHPEFKRAVNQLPKRYEPQFKPRFYTLINNFGTHFITKVTLGGSVHSVTSIKQCVTSLQGLTVDEVRQCLDVEAALSVQGKVNSRADYKHCDEAKSKTESKSSFSSNFNDRYTQISGGQTTEPELLFSADKDPNAYKEWLSSVPLNPEIISYSLLPLHELLPTSCPARKLLRQAVRDYILENSLWRNCTEPCRVGAKHNPGDMCVCTCHNNQNVNQACCPTRRGVAHVQVTVIRATGLWGDTTTSTDGYVKVFNKNNLLIGRTHVVYNNNFPTWSQHFDLGSVQLADFESVRLEVWDEDNKWDDDLLGVCTISLKSGAQDNSCPLNHGVLYYKSQVSCGPSLAGPACTDYVASPMNMELEKIYVSRHARRPSPDMLQDMGVVPDPPQHLMLAQDGRGDTQAFL